MGYFTVAHFRMEDKESEEIKEHEKEISKLQGMKAIRGKKTSEGYEPKPDEKVEVRGD